MKLFKKLSAYKIEEAEGAYVGFGILRAKDYEREKFGRLYLFSLNIGGIKFIKKLFLRNVWQKK